MATPEWVKKMLRLRGIAFEELQHAEAFTAQQVAQREHVSGHRVAKVVVVKAADRFVELILPASRKVEMQLVREVLNVPQARLASEAEMERAFPDCEPGSLPPLDHYKDVEVIMDRSMEVEGDIIFQAGTHRDAVRLNFRDWFRVVQPRVEEFSQPPEPAFA